MSNTKYAVLDETGVLLGYQDEEPPVMTNLFIEVPKECNLEEEKYRWDWDNKTFIVNRSIFDPDDPNIPIAMGLIAVRDSKLFDLPDETLLWLRRYE